MLEANSRSCRMSAQEEQSVCTAMMQLSSDVAFVWDLTSDVLCCSSK